LLASKWFFCPDLVYARREKRIWLIGNLVKKAFRWLRGHGVNTIAIEDLDIQKTLDEGFPPNEGGATRHRGSLGWAIQPT
ncbi:MAG: hypothetical protein DRJ51_05450, partial [Thermoprotei archaeon]